MWVKIGGEQNNKNIRSSTRYPSRYPRISRRESALKVLGIWQVHSPWFLLLGGKYNCTLRAVWVLNWVGLAIVNT